MGTEIIACILFLVAFAVYYWPTSKKNSITIIGDNNIVSSGDVKDEDKEINNDQ